MATIGEQSLLAVLHGGELLPGLAAEVAEPLSAHGSANIPLLSRAALDVVAWRRGDQAELNRSAALWAEHLEPGRVGVAMRCEFGTTVYPAWIVCPIATAARVHAGTVAGERARWWCRAWAAVAVAAMGWERGRLVSDADDPPGAPAPGPVWARSAEDARPGFTRRHAGVFPSVFVGERSWQRSWRDGADWRLDRAYLDQPVSSQVAHEVLGLPWASSSAEDGDWVARYALGVRRTFGPVAGVLPLEEGELEALGVLWQARRDGAHAAAAVRAVLPWLEGWLPSHRYTLAGTEGGLWWLCESGGRTSTATVYGSAWEAGGVQGWLACDDGRRKSRGAPEAVVPGRGWESGAVLRCERADGVHGTRELAKPGGAELWRLELGPEGARLVAPAGPAPAPPPPAGPGSGTSPVPERPRRRRCRWLRRLFGGR